MMEKRSPKLPLGKEKIQSSCIMGLVEMFDLCSGWGNQKLLTNGRPMRRNVSDAGRPRKANKHANINELQGIAGEADLVMPDAEASETNGMNLMREEFATLKQMKKQKKPSKQQHISSVGAINQSKNNSEDVSKTPAKADLIPARYFKDKFILGNQWSSCSAEISLDKQDIIAMFEEIHSQIHQDRRSYEDIQKDFILSKHNQLDQVNEQLLQRSAKAFIDQIFIHRKHHRKGGSSKCKQFSDVSEILNLKKDLFLKVMQDPNFLVVKNTKNLESPKNLQSPRRGKERMKQFLDSKSSECGCSGIRNYQKPECLSMTIQKKNTKNLLWNKFKYRYGYSSKGNAGSGGSNKIVLLKPESRHKQNSEDVSCHCSSLQSHQSFKTKGQNCKSAYFSFKDIKRKFKQALGESQQNHHFISLDENLKKLDLSKHSSTDVDKGMTHGSTPANVKTREKECKPADPTSINAPQIAPISETVCKRLNSSTSSSKCQLDIFAEGKRHLSERLRNVSVREIQPRKEASRTLQMILSSPERDFFVTHTPKDNGNASVSAEMSFSPCNNIQMTAESSLKIEKGEKIDFPSPMKQAKEVPSSPDFRGSNDQSENSKITPYFTENFNAETGVLEIVCSTNDDLSLSDCANKLEANEVAILENSNILEVPHEPRRINDPSSRQDTETINCCEGDGHMEGPNLNITSEDHPLRSLSDPSRPLNICNLEIVESAKYKEEHQSPVSVLEPFSPDDNSSPTSIMTRPAESTMQPRCIDFENYSGVVSLKDPKANVGACTDEKQSLYMYVRAVMQASGLNFDALSLKGSSPHVPHTDMVDGVEVESCYDLQLLFDCIHEVLLDVFEYYFGCSPLVSFMEPKIRSVPKEENVIDEVVTEVNLYLLPKDGQPNLDQLITKDIRTSSTWLDLRPDAEDILIQVAEDVLQDSLLDTLLEVHM